ncbi:MAG: sulfatase-like hydrolase/transferase, partial [Planctomycetota bacterium]
GPFRDSIPRASNWLNARRTTHNAQPFFLFLHGYDVHRPYSSISDSYRHRWISEHPEIDLRLDEIMSNWRFSKKFEQDLLSSPVLRQHQIAHYDGAINYADEQIGGFLAALEKIEPLDNMMIIIFSDHGSIEKILGKDRFHVPLIIKLPLSLKSAISNPQSKINTQVQLIDIMPTIIDYLSIPIPHQAQGRSLKPLIENTASPNFNKYVFSNTTEDDGVFSFRVRTDKWKLVCTPFPQTEAGQHYAVQLYDCVNDQTEDKNVAQEYPAVVTELEKQLCGLWKEIENQRIKPVAAGKITPEMLKAIRQHGYWTENDNSAGDISVKKHETEMKSETIIITDD